METSETYQGGKLDYLGIDDGTRQIPDFVVQNSTPSPFSAVNDLYVNGIYNSQEGSPTGFNDNFGTQLSQALPNTNFSITGGRFFPAAKANGNSSGFGFLGLIAHENSYRYANGSIKIINAQSEERLNYDFDKYRRETSTTGLLNLHYRINPENNITINTLVVNNSGDEVRETWGSHFDYIRNIYSRRITYQQNYMWVNQIVGAHQFIKYGKTPFSRLKIDWKASYSQTGSQEPDRRQFVAFYDDLTATNQYAINHIDRNENHIFYSRLKENEIAAKGQLNYVLKYGDIPNERGDTILGELIRARMGVDYKSKIRIFDYKQYNYVLNELSANTGNNLNIYDINDFLNSERHTAGEFYLQEVANYGSSYLAVLDVLGVYGDLKFKWKKMAIHSWNTI